MFTWVWYEVYDANGNLVACGWWNIWAEFVGHGIDHGMFRVCHIAEFRPNPLLRTREQQHRDGPEAAANSGKHPRGTFEAALERVVRSALDPEPSADLLEQLPPSSREEDVVGAALSTWRALSEEGAGIFLVECELSGGHRVGSFSFTVTGVAESAGVEVIAGDPVYPGFALVRSPAGRIRLLPRVWRRVCSNGAVRALAEGEDAAEEPDEVADGMRRCLDAPAFRETVDCFRRMAAEAVSDPRDALHEAAVSASSLPSVLARFRSQDDRSLWGLLNAMTIEAKRSATWRERLDREVDAGRLAR